MKHSLLILAAALAAAVSAPAQISIEARFGRHPRATVKVGGHHHHDHHHHCEPVRRPVQRGRWETVEEQCLVPGYWRDEHVPPTYGWIVDSCGHRHWGIVDRGGCRRVWVPARWETRSRRVWVAC
jgi:hypothetical protein